MKHIYTIYLTLCISTTLFAPSERKSNQFDDLRTCNRQITKHVTRRYHLGQRSFDHVYDALRTKPHTKRPKPHIFHTKQCKLG